MPLQRLSPTPWATMPPPTMEARTGHVNAFHACANKKVQARSSWQKKKSQKENAGGFAPRTPLAHSVGLRPLIGCHHARHRHEPAGDLLADASSWRLATPEHPDLLAMMEANSMSITPRPDFPQGGASRLKSPCPSFYLHRRFRVGYFFPYLNLVLRFNENARYNHTAK